MKTDLIRKYISREHNRHQKITKFKVIEKNDKNVILKLTVENHDYRTPEYQVQKLTLKIKNKNIIDFKKGKYVLANDYKIMKNKSIMKPM